MTDKYRKLTDQDFDRILKTVMDEQPSGALLAVSGAYEVFSEEYNNEVLERWEAEQAGEKNDIGPPGIVTYQVAQELDGLSRAVRCAAENGLADGGDPIRALHYIRDLISTNQTFTEMSGNGNFVCAYGNVRRLAYTNSHVVGTESVLSVSKDGDLHIVEAADALRKVLTVMSAGKTK